ncbi:MAG: NPCBM/NEW2 domain-containing protein [Phycisphaerae bacterium]|nr:NPCBM/NEW2 domain-containing protein [Phycisphaerae bacterium]
MTIPEYEFDLLVLDLLENNLSDQRIHTLEALIFSNPDYLSRYCDFVNTYSAVQIKLEAEFDDDNNSCSSEISFDMVLWQDFADYEQKAKAIPIPVSKVETKPVLVTDVRERKRKMSPIRLPSSQINLYAFLGVLLAMLVIISYDIMSPQSVGQGQGTVIESIQTRWDNENFHPGVNDRLSSKDAILNLASGFVRIRLDAGAEVLIQAPAQFRLEHSNQLYLRSGKLTSVVPPAAQGFVVRTPSATVVDYGTEFGVLVEKTGQTEAHVFKGEVELRCGSNPIRHGGGQRLLCGLAGTVSPLMEFVGGPTKGQPSLFVRDTKNIKWQLQTGWKIDLADIVGGGNGFGSGGIGCGIDPITGTVISQKTLSARKSPGYTSVEDNPFVDGIFVPDGQKGLVTVTSSGISYDSFIATNGLFFEEPVNVCAKNQIENQQGDTPVTMNGVVYGDGIRTALSMHANLGITFDLEQLRKVMPERQLMYFNTLCGIPDYGVNKHFTLLDVSILVDGRCVFHRDHIKSGDLPMPIQVSFEPGDRFLTLVVTDSGNKNYFDRAFFAEPCLEFESR